MYKLSIAETYLRQPETVVLVRRKIDNCIAKKKFLLGNNKDEYEKAKFSYLEK